MKEPQTVTDCKGNIYINPGQMTREEAEIYFPNQPERSKREDLDEPCNFCGTPSTKNPKMKCARTTICANYP